MKNVRECMMQEFNEQINLAKHLNYENNVPLQAFRLHEKERERQRLIQ